MPLNKKDQTKRKSLPESVLVANVLDYDIAEDEFKL